MTQPASAGTPEYEMFMRTVTAGQRNAATVACRRCRARVDDFCRTHAGVPALAVFVVACGERDPASLSHPTTYTRIAPLVAVVAVGCDKLAGYHVACVMTQPASAGTPEYEMFMRTVTAGQRNAATVACRRCRARVDDFCRTHAGVPALAVFVVACGERDPASLSHPSSHDTPKTAAVSS